MSKKLTHEQFIERLSSKNEHYKNGLFTIEELYDGIEQKILIQTKYGYCRVKCENLMRGFGFNIKNAVDKTNFFIKQAKDVHLNYYVYDKTIYVNNSIKIIITCPIHGDFEQIPNSHLQDKGCRVCGYIKNAQSLKRSDEQLLKDFRKVHGDRYEYPELVNNGSHNKIKIICSIHGLFEQEPHSHIKGQGCASCGSEKNRYNPSTWSISNWIKSAEKSKNFDSFKVYIIELYDESTNERFFKIGRTFLKIKSRLLKVPYKYNILHFFEGSAKEMFDLEVELKRNNKEYKYTPKKEFGGQFECFNKITQIYEL